MTEIKNLSIVFITNNWAPFSAGVVSSLNAFRQELMRQGHVVTIVTLDFEKRVSDEPGVVRIYCPIKMTYNGIPLAVPWRADRQVYKILSKIKPDIIHLHHPFLLGVSGLKAAKELGIPCIFTYHSLYEKYTHYVPLPQQLLKKVVRSKVRNFCKQVDGIIVPGKEAARLLLRDKIATPHIVLPSPLQDIYVENSMQGTHRIPRVEDTQFKLMTCSRFVKEKNIPFLLECFAQVTISQCTLTLAGFGSEKENLQSYAYETLGLSKDRVFFVEKLNSEQLCKLYAESDLFVFASLAETQGLVLAEAMINWLPVVALYGPGQEDIVVDGENGFLVHSLEQMKLAIERIAGNKPLHDMLSLHARKTGLCYLPMPLTQKLVSFYRLFL